MQDDVNVGMSKESTSTYFKDSVCCSLLTTTMRDKV